jgi:hypothetical protein
LVSALATRFANASCANDNDGVRIDVPCDGVVYRAHARMAPTGRVSVQVPSTDGFELSVSWTERVFSPPRPSVFDDSCLIETNDVSLASLWLDGEARHALLASRYISGTPGRMRLTVPLMRDGTWQHEVRSDQVLAYRDDIELVPERVVDMLVASLALASRPVRWARGYRPIAHALGGIAATRVELGGRPLVRVRRGSADIVVRLLRRLGPADHGRLRTVVGAHRVGGGETLSLIAEDLPRCAWPPANDVGQSTLRIDDRARALLDTARPATTIVRRHDVEITFDGAFADADRLGAAIELAAYWATNRQHVGPYR